MRKDELQYSPILSKIAMGYSMPGLVYDKILPKVQLQDLEEKIPKFGKGFLKQVDTKRQLREDVKITDSSGFTLVSAELQEHEITRKFDRSETEYAKKVFNLELATTKDCQQQIEINKEIACAELVTDLNSYATGCKETLSGTDIWDNASSKPIDQIEDAKATVKGKIGYKPNTLILTEQSYNILKRHSTLIERIKYSQKGILTADLIKEILDFDNIIIASSMKADDDENLTDIWGDNAIVTDIRPAKVRDKYTPAWGYTFTRAGYSKTQKWDNDNGKIRYVSVTDFFSQKIVSNDAAYIIKNTVS